MFKFCNCCMSHKMTALMSGLFLFSVAVLECGKIHLRGWASHSSVEQCILPYDSSMQCVSVLSKIIGCRSQTFLEVRMQWGQWCRWCMLCVSYTLVNMACFLPVRQRKQELPPQSVVYQPGTAGKEFMTWTLMNTCKALCFLHDAHILLFLCSQTWWCRTICPG